MATISFEKTFTDKYAADAYAENYLNTMWGYDPTIRISVIDGQWVVTITRCASCD